MTKVTVKNFESALVELEALVAVLEAGNVPLAEALDAYQKGARLVRECQDALAVAESRIQVLEQDLVREFSAETELPAGENL